MAREFTVVINIVVRTGQFNRRIKQVNTRMLTLGKTFGRVQRTMVAFAALFIARGLIRGMKNTVVQASNLQFQMIQISRIAGITGERLEGMKNALLKLSTEVVASVSELSELAIVAARAGVRTEEGMIQIATAASKMAELSDISAVEATNALIEIIKAMGLATDQADKVGSAIVGIAKTVAATEGEIVGALQRMAGVGRILGFTIPQLVALAGVTIQMGVKASRAGTLWTRAFLQLDKNSRKAAKAIGITDIQFRKLLGKDSFDALTLLLVKIGELKDKTDQLKALREIFQGRGVKVAAPILVELEFFLDRANEANRLFKEGTLLAEDYKLVMSSLNVVMKLLNQAFEILQIKFGEQMLPALTKLALVIRDKILGSEDQIKSWGKTWGRAVDKLRIIVEDEEAWQSIVILFKNLGVVVAITAKAFGVLALAIASVPILFTDTAQGAATIASTLSEKMLQLGKRTIEKSKDAFTDAEFEKVIQDYNQELGIAFETTQDLGDASSFAGRNIHSAFTKVTEAADKVIEKMDAIGEKLKDQDTIDLDKITITTPDSLAGGFEDASIRIQKALEEAGSFSDNLSQGLVATWDNTWKSIQSGFSDVMSRMILQGGKFSDRMKVFWEGMKIAFVKAITDMIAQLAVWAVKQIVFGSIVVAAASTFASALAGIWAVPALLATIATLGTAALGAPAAIAASIGATQAITAAGLGMKKGGIVPGFGSGDRVPALLEPGELVIPKSQVSNVVNNRFNPSVVINLEGSIILDDPNAVERLYREHIRDRIRQDVRTGRDVFFG